MNYVILFLKNHWELIVSVSLFILSFILQLLKKKPFKVVDSISQFIQNLACEVINEVEAKADGKKYIDYEGFITPKIDVAVSLISKKVKTAFPNIDIDKYYLFIRDTIEKILCTPQKHDKN